MGHSWAGEVTTLIGSNNRKLSVHNEMKYTSCISFCCRFRSIARSYFRKAHGVLLLYDVTSESSFLNVRAWVDQIQVTVEMLRHKCSHKKAGIDFTISFVFLQDSAEEKIPMCVIGNKVDLREQHPEGSCVSSLHGEKLAKVCNFSFIQTPGPPRCLNKLSAVRYVNPFLAGIRGLVLRNECQRGNQCRRGCASSGEVGGQSLSFKYFSFTNHDNT